MDDLLAFYCSVIRPILEYGIWNMGFAGIWNGGLTQQQKKSIERTQKRVLTYEKTSTKPNEKARCLLDNFILDICFVLDNVYF